MLSWNIKVLLACNKFSRMHNSEGNNVYMSIDPIYPLCINCINIHSERNEIFNLHTYIFSNLFLSEATKAQFRALSYQSISCLSSEAIQLSVRLRKAKEASSNGSRHFEEALNCFVCLL